MLYAVDSFQQEGGELGGNDNFVFALCRSKYNRLLYLQMAGWRLTHSTAWVWLALK